jgi:hypothetical protein
MWLAVFLVFAAQVGVMFLLGNPPKTAPSHPSITPIVYLNTNPASELLALQDQTIFMLPHRNNFSGPAWLTITRQTFKPADWSEPARPFSLPPEQLGAAFDKFMETSPPPQLAIAIGSALDVVGLDSSPMQPISAASTVRIQGDLARRRLLTPIHLPPQTNSDSDVVPDTEVQVLVDARGNTFSPVILNGNKNTTAAADALDFAKRARFEPLRTTGPERTPPDTMTFGEMIFEWQTVPPAATNAPLSTP